MPAPTVLKGESSNGTARLPPLPLQLAGSPLGLVTSLLPQPLGPPTVTPPIQRLVIIGIKSGEKGPTAVLSLTPPHPSSAGLAQRGGPEMSRAARASEQRGFLFPVFFVVVAVFFEKLVID